MVYATFKDVITTFNMCVCLLKQNNECWSHNAFSDERSARAWAGYGRTRRSPRTSSNQYEDGRTSCTTTTGWWASTSGIQSFIRCVFKAVSFLHMLLPAKVTIFLIYLGIGDKKWVKLNIRIPFPLKCLQIRVV